MNKILIINGHQPYPFAPGRLNGTLTTLAQELLQARGYQTQLTEVAQGWELEDELDKHQWADVVLLQMPVNWMSMPWSLKKYMDELYTAGMDGRLCRGDGRSGPNEHAKYGRGGSLSSTKYMMSVTFNAPEEAFTAPGAFFEGRSVDDLLWPMHLNFKFFGMSPLPTFAAYDVMKNPQIERDLARFREHLHATFAAR